MISRIRTFTLRGIDSYNWSAYAAEAEGPQLACLSLVTSDGILSLDLALSDDPSDFDATVFSGTLFDLNMS